MFLPKPNALSIPECTSPMGIGLEACNSGNSCSKQSCDVNKGGSNKCGASLTWTAIAAIGTCAGAAASAAS